VLLTGQQNTKNALRYLDYSPTIRDIDAILVNLRQDGLRGAPGNIYVPMNLVMDDYVSIALSFIFKVLNSVEVEGVLSNRENLSPFGEKGSRKYQEILMEVVIEFIGCKSLKEK
jgi:hypothetical protein